MAIRFHDNLNLPYLLKALSLKRVFPPQGTRDENMSIVIKLRPLPFILKLNKIINIEIKVKLLNFSPFLLINKSKFSVQI